MPEHSTTASEAATTAPPGLTPEISEKLAAMAARTHEALDLGGIFGPSNEDFLFNLYMIRAANMTRSRSDKDMEARNREVAGGLDTLDKMAEEFLDARDRLRAYADLLDDAQDRVCTVYARLYLEELAAA